MAFPFSVAGVIERVAKRLSTVTTIVARMAQGDAYRRPSPALFALEIPRATVDAAVLGPAWPVLKLAPHGDGHPVLVLPGFTASDVSTRILRRFLRGRGYHVHAWRLGRNLGPNKGTVEGLRKRVRQLADQHRRPMSLVGWSLGGIYAREIARAAPSAVRQVITLGSPLRLRDRRESNAGALLSALRRPQREDYLGPRPPERGRGPLPVPATAIFTRSDGVVPWRACLEVPSDTSESVEVVGSHSGLGYNPAVLWVIADRLAQPEGTWHTFKVRRLARPLFPKFSE
jgi:pimeloyl-ACP methyl ester carboxylesterase